MLKNFLLLIISILFVLIVFEVFLRITGISYPYYMRVDAVTGHSLRPGAEGWWTREGRAYVKVNSDGLRDREYSVKKPENTIRIAVLGDSYAEAKQVDMKDAFWSVIEEMSTPCTDKEVEVINFGVSGFGTAQEYLLLKDRVWKYNPDYILLAFLSGNDLRNNSKNLDQNENIPYFVLENDELKLDNSFRDTKFFKNQNKLSSQLFFKAINNSRVLQIVNRARQVVRDREKSDTNQGEPALQEIGLEELIYKTPETEQWKEAWIITEKIIELMKSNVHENNAELIIALVTNSIEVTPDETRREELKSKLSVTDLKYPQNRMQEIGKRIGIPVIALAPRFLDHALKNNICLHGFEGKCEGHWNEKGHKLAGEIISEELCKILE